MAASSLRTQHDTSKEQIQELQYAIQENKRKLEDVKEKKLRAEKEILQCTRETEQRVELMEENSGVVDVLLQLGLLLQKERHLSEQLNGQASADRNESNDLQKRNDCVTNEARNHSAEILEVEQSLSEAKAPNMAAAQALIHAPTRKSKRNQSKPK